MATKKWIRIGITGSNGFVGKETVQYMMKLQRKGVRIKLVLFDRTPNINEIGKHIRFFQGDVRNFKQMMSAFKKCDVIIHLAAESNVMRAEADPHFTMSTAILGTYNVCRLLKSKMTRVRYILLTSSREVYGQAQYVPVDENHPLGGTNIYAQSKIAQEWILNYFRRWHPTAIGILRLANVIGAGDPNLSRVVPSWLTKASKGEALTLYGGKQVIDFIPIQFVVKVIAHFALKRIVDTVNVGSGIGTPILELAELIMNTIPGSTIDRQPARQAETTAYIANTDRLRKWGYIPPENPLAIIPTIAASYAATK